MHRIVFAVSAAFALSSPAVASERNWHRASDVAVITLGAWSVGVPIASGDSQGALQAGMSVGASYAVTTGLKEAIPANRPDASNDRSFPSGHTAAAFGAATSIWERRGPKEGIPAVAVAAFVGLARVQADKHYWRDVIAGAAIGTASGILLTKPLADRRVAIAPWVGGHGGGATVDFAF